MPASLTAWFQHKTTYCIMSYIRYELMDHFVWLRKRNQKMMEGSRRIHVREKTVMMTGENNTYISVVFSCHHDSSYFCC